MSCDQKHQILRAVEASDLPLKQTLERLDVPISTYYRWRNKLKSQGVEGLKDRSSYKGKVWNQLLEEEEQIIQEVAMQCPDWSCRQVACYVTDRCGVGADRHIQSLKRLLERKIRSFHGPEDLVFLVAAHANIPPG